MLGRARFSVPLFGGIRPVDRARIPTEVVAGITLACLAIPEVMGYTKIAGMPVITGLYTMLIPTAVFAIMGSSRHLVVGADSATAAILAAGLAGMAAEGSAEYVALAGMLALLAAGFLILARIVRLGFLANFLSRTVLVGFLTGVGIQVACGQVGGALGVPSGTGGTLHKLWGTLQNIGETSLPTLAVSVSVIAVILGARVISRSIPGPLIAVVGAIVVSYWLDLASDGVSVVGPVPGGLPSFGRPDVSLSQTRDLVITAVSIFIVVLAQSAATSRAYAERYREPFDENVDLIGLGAANLAAGLSGAFVVNGSPTKTEIVDSAGGRSQLPALVTSVIVLIVLVFLTGPLQYMPEAVLASVVLLIGIELVDVRGMARIYRARLEEFWVAAITAAVVVVAGVEQGIILAMVLSVIIHLRHSYEPRNGVLTSIGLRAWAPVPKHGPAPQLLPGLVLYRFNASLYYANANRFAQDVRVITAPAEPPLMTLCIDAAGIDDIDYTGMETLRELITQARGDGVTVIFAEVADNVRTQLERAGIIDLVGADAIYNRIREAVEAHGGSTTTP